MAAARRAVFLDRDGVLNRAMIVDARPYPPASVQELEVLPGVVEACVALRAAGLLLIVVTNQPDVARGVTSREAVDELNQALLATVPVDEILVCWHDDSDGCTCRKPAPGLLLDAAHRWNIDLGRSVMVGDRWRDIEAGQRAGCHTVFVDRSYVERQPERPDLVVAQLPEAVGWIVDLLDDAHRRSIGS